LWLGRFFFEKEYGFVGGSLLVEGLVPGPLFPPKKKPTLPVNKSCVLRLAFMRKTNNMLQPKKIAMRQKWRNVQFFKKQKLVLVERDSMRLVALFTSPALAISCLPTHCISGVHFMI